jgi:hypothetical protein
LDTPQHPLQDTLALERSNVHKSGTFPAYILVILLPAKGNQMILDITQEMIAALGDSDLRELIARLCELEAHAQGHSISAVTWGGHQNAPDGGIDVRVSLPSGVKTSGYIPAPATGLQVKAENMPPSKITGEMCPESVLRPSIEALAALGGAYIIVSSKDSVSDTFLKDRLTAMTDALAGSAHAASITLKFYDSRLLASWVSQHPGMAAWVREKTGQPSFEWYPFKDWSSSPAPLDSPYLLDKHVRLFGTSIHDSSGLSATDGINSLRRILAEPGRVVRLVGLSGVGKTRLVQALFDARTGAAALLQGNALYADVSAHPEPSAIDMLSRLAHLKRRCVMILDNCGAVLHRRIAAEVAKPDCPLSVITIEYDINDDEPENTDVFRLETASVELVEKIVGTKYPDISDPDRRVIAEFSDGNARIALALADTAQKGESLVNLRSTELFERLFRQGKDPDPRLLQAAKIGSLLYSFDGENLDGTASELPRLAALAGMSVDELYVHVEDLFRRKLVQKRGQWRAILPHALSQRLAKLGLEDIPPQRIAETFVDAPARMRRSFSRRLGYLHDHPRAVAIVSEWFAPGGLLENLGNLDPLAEEILENVAPVDQERTLAYFESTASRHDWFFGEKNKNTRRVQEISRALAFEPKLFNRSVAIIKEFALAELKSRSEPNLDLIKSLFHMYLSGSHAPAQQRADFVKACLESADPKLCELGLSLLDAMLESDHFTAFHSYEFGARKRDYGLHPDGAGMREWFASVFALVRASGSANTPLARKIKRKVALKFSSLFANTGMSKELMAMAYAFASDEGWSEGWIGVQKTSKDWTGKMPPELHAELEALERKLRPSDLAAEIRTYALPPQYGSLDISDLGYDDNDPLKAQNDVAAKCVGLGQSLAKDQDLLAVLLPEILLSNSNMTAALGRGLAAGCDSVEACWNTLIPAYLALPSGSRHPTMIGGFLEGAAARDLASAERFLDSVLLDPALHDQLVNWQSYAGIQGRAHERLMSALDVDSVPVSAFEQLAYGRLHEGFNDDQLRSFIQKLLTRNGMRAAAHILSMRGYAGSKDCNLSETEQAACRDLLAAVFFVKPDQYFIHHTERIIRCSLAGPENATLARDLCERLLRLVHGLFTSGHNLRGVFAALIETSPVAVLDILLEQASTVKKRGPAIFDSVREDSSSPFSRIASNIWIAWAARKPETRYALLAQVLPYHRTVKRSKAIKCTKTAKKLINLAPDPRIVLDIFLARAGVDFTPDAMTEKLPLFDELSAHRNPEVIAWAAEARLKFTARLDQARKFEASFNRKDEGSFE